jgi:hypothetical protein
MLDNIEFKTGGSGGGSGSSGPKVEIPSGRYKATFTKVEETTKKKFQSEEREPAMRLVFEFKTKDGADAALGITVTPKITENSNLVKYVSMMHPAGELDADQMVPARFKGFLAQQIGKKFTIAVKLGDKPAANGNRWANITTLSPIDEDDIPF